MSLPAFDTHAYVKRLQQAGFDEKQAEAQAELQSQVLSALVTEKLATKEDIINLKKEDLAGIKMDIIRLEGELKHLIWMAGFLLMGVVTILIKLFLHG